ncbi:uncharacterized protein (TIGR00369 family) [Sphingomonas jinjuensis]|uniref:Uncharacterized protein (TIGR00369 family) n=1 Tax=Sphingomonas jinjuensis TaxID=535907 RepID=A0A840FIS0_9SPHN|nr:PaaI family thioesterase [Sphingomonas jinjuensis]MBB4153858.1 uncharacterized protein (TIGR00369 family) [Sphingomonas jinjuensis]
MTGFDIDRFCAFALKLGHGGALGIALGSHGPEWVELTLPYDSRLVGDPASGVLASGPIVALMDMAASLAVWQRRGAFHPQATLDLRVDYLRPATPHRAVIGRGECVRVTRNIAFVRGTAHDGDPADPVATVAGTFMLLDAAA